MPHLSSCKLVKVKDDYCDINIEWYKGEQSTISIRPQDREIYHPHVGEAIISVTAYPFLTKHDLNETRWTHTVLYHCNMDKCNHPDKLYALLKSVTSVRKFEQILPMLISSTTTNQPLNCYRYTNSSYSCDIHANRLSCSGSCLGIWDKNGICAMCDNEVSYQHPQIFMAESIYILANRTREQRVLLACTASMCNSLENTRRILQAHNNEFDIDTFLYNVQLVSNGAYEPKVVLILTVVYVFALQKLS
ncbi:unnamed protein product [Didymodactylos carnosus]|uniref:Uncharacterized protein n=1 Tax=Didymodactylos carnosus TaxID=1234261 RepID=A0A815E500_9BILA|nr:unnamed protein product [Didymodactylos carnosus]CAF1305336.1 unnamed protein product [Didymodactylos carnosus]CAF3743765.1 unnamed protein product [Didymodactylos carnosus]CAF4137628.1 unnamed protein product [Didymodactylos carnosus]